ncbi:hypothetical protein Bca52824_075700 [Brassica carinata]|uniref:Ribose-phosphate pyrophosphokinase N-terminal domain-containing protein n=1 Tax=Brassica carinata TaxID=52824 RepID=A0A8X7PQW5_BRACI|nr:hypothetical protein Bca52824_075700 [Brassica carinata]
MTTDRETVRNRGEGRSDWDSIGPTCPPANEILMELLVMIDACRRASPKTITAVIPLAMLELIERQVLYACTIRICLGINLLPTLKEVCNSSSRMGAVYSLIVREEEILMEQRKRECGGCGFVVRKERDEDIELVVPLVFSLCTKVLCFITSCHDHFIAMSRIL